MPVKVRMSIRMRWRRSGWGIVLALASLLPAAAPATDEDTIKNLIRQAGNANDDQDRLQVLRELQKQSGHHMNGKASYLEPIRAFAKIRLRYLETPPEKPPIPGAKRGAPPVQPGSRA